MSSCSLVADRAPFDVTAVLPPPLLQIIAACLDEGEEVLLQKEWHFTAHDLNAISLERFRASGRVSLQALLQRAPMPSSMTPFSLYVRAEERPDHSYGFPDLTAIVARFPQIVGVQYDAGG